MNKVYVVEVANKPSEVFFTKQRAHEFAENMYGSKTDGICVDNVRVVAYIPVDANSN